MDSIASGYVTAHGPGLVHGITGEPANFTISTKDAGAGSDQMRGKYDVHVSACRPLIGRRRAVPASDWLSLSELAPDWAIESASAVDGLSQIRRVTGARIGVKGVFGWARDECGWSDVLLLVKVGEPLVLVVVGVLVLGTKLFGPFLPKLWANFWLIFL